MKYNGSIFGVLYSSKGYGGTAVSTAAVVLTVLQSSKVKNNWTTVDWAQRRVSALNQTPKRTFRTRHVQYIEEPSVIPLGRRGWHPSNTSKANGHSTSKCLAALRQRLYFRIRMYEPILQQQQQQHDTAAAADSCRTSANSKGRRLQQPPEFQTSIPTHTPFHWLQHSTSTDNSGE